MHISFESSNISFRMSRRSQFLRAVCLIAVFQTSLGQLERPGPPYPEGSQAQAPVQSQRPQWTSPFSSFRQQKSPQFRMPFANDGMLKTLYKALGSSPLSISFGGGEPFSTKVPSNAIQPVKNSYSYNPPPRNALHRPYHESQKHNQYSYASSPSGSFGGQQGRGSLFRMPLVSDSMFKTLYKAIGLGGFSKTVGGGEPFSTHPNAIQPSISNYQYFPPSQNALNHQPQPQSAFSYESPRQASPWSIWPSGTFRQHKRSPRPHHRMPLVSDSMLKTLHQALGGSSFNSFGGGAQLQSQSPYDIQPSVQSSYHYVPPSNNVPLVQQTEQLFGSGANQNGYLYAQPSTNFPVAPKIYNPFTSNSYAQQPQHRPVGSAPIQTAHVYIPQVAGGTGSVQKPMPNVIVKYERQGQSHLQGSHYYNQRQQVPQYSQVEPVYILHSAQDPQPQQQVQVQHFRPTPATAWYQTDYVQPVYQAQAQNFEQQVAAGSSKFVQLDYPSHRRRAARRPNFGHSRSAGGRPFPVFATLGKGLDVVNTVRRGVKRGTGTVVASGVKLGGSLAFAGAKVMAKAIKVASSI